MTATAPTRPHHAHAPTPEQVIGVVALLPLALAWLVGLVLPTFATVGTSLLRTTALTRRSVFVGFENYQMLFSSRLFGHALVLTALTALAQVVAVAILPPLLAVAAASLAPATRLPLRLLFTLPLAMATPIAIGLTLWGLSRTELTSPVLAPFAVIRTQALYAFLAACGVGLVAYVAALRRPGNRSPWHALGSGPFLVVWALTLVATAAWGIQSMVIPFVATAGGPAAATTTLGLLAFDLALRFFEFGPGAAAATLELAVLAAFGTLAGLLVVVARLRITVTEPAPAAEGNRPLGWVVIAVCAVVLLVGILPLLGNSIAPASAYGRAARMGYALAMVHTLWPTALQVLVVLAVATLGAIGIGLLRPLGAHSEWLLLPFSPWLFVTVQPLSATAYLDIVRTGGPANVVTALWPVLQFAIPLLFVLTALFGGLAPRWQEARARGVPDALLRSALVPAMPMVLVLGAVLAWIGVHDLDWALVSTTQTAASNGTLWIVVLRSSFSVDPGLLHAALTLVELPLVVVFVLAYWAFQAFYADRLAIETADAAQDVVSDGAKGRASK